MIDEIIAAVKNARIDEPINELLFNETHFDCTNDLIFFIKPEITLADDKIKLEEILEMIFEKIECYNFKIKNIRIINAAYLEKHNIIAQHYGVINKLSKDINNSITAEGRAKFETIFGINFNKAEVLGSLEFIEKYPHFTATGLSYLWQNAATEKLAGGTYA
ncbi:MAG: hypothetical protein JXP36_02355, partial [Bacteroidales bacterium]|nr:hypothetical protein [Bacteroidales bacterium]